MATTPNYGWVTPAPTDFVTDLPADFEVFADAVDADLAGLLGGTTGQVLAKDSNADHDFSWITVGGGGKVLQVVSAVTSTSTVIASTSYTDTTITANITPSANTSKILVLVSADTTMLQTSPAANNRAYARIMRDATQVYEIVTNSVYYFDSSGTGTTVDASASSLVYLDSPATTSAITYKVQGKVSGTGSGTQVEYQDASSSSIVLLEIGA